jgi:hypothetical protein
MAGLDREPIYAALLARLAELVPGTLKSVSRRLPPAAEPPLPTEQPCLFVPCGDEIPEFQPRMPYKWLPHLAIILYARTDDAAQAPSSALTPIIKAIEAKLQWRQGDGFPAPGSPTTLGQLCEWVRIVRVEYGEGVATGQGIAFIPLEILAVEDVR